MNKSDNLQEDDENVNYENMTLKVLYSFDDNSSNFLSRSNQPFTIKTAHLPIDDTQVVTIGGVEVKTCIEQVMNSSPEHFENDAYDYNVYAKDILEPDEPLVGYGLYSKILDSYKSTIIAGRVCSNFASILGSGGSSRTLEVRLKFLKVAKRVFAQPNAIKRPAPQPITNQPIPATRQNSMTREQPMPASRQNSVTQFKQRDEELPAMSSVKSQVIEKTLKKARPNPIQRAERTQSLPNFKLPVQNNQTSRLTRKSSIIDEDVLNRFKNAPFTNSDGRIEKIPIEKDDRVHYSVEPVLTPKPTQPNICMNSNCKTQATTVWRNLEVEGGPSGTICNACFLFFKSKGFMRPWDVVRRYNRNKKYATKGAQNSSSPINKIDEESNDSNGEDDSNKIDESTINGNITSNDKQKNQGKTPNGIYNELNDFMSELHAFGGPLTDIDPLPYHNFRSPNLNNLPMMATKSNTRVINLYDEEEKENYAPNQIRLRRSVSGNKSNTNHNDNLVKDIEESIEGTTNDDIDLLRISPSKMSQTFNEFESYLTSFGQLSDDGKSPKRKLFLPNNSSPNQWVNTIFSDTTPKDQTPNDLSNTCNTLPIETPLEANKSDETEDENSISEKELALDGLPKKSPFQLKRNISTMPSSPLLLINEEDNHLSRQRSNLQQFEVDIEKYVDKEGNSSTLINTSSPKNNGGSPFFNDKLTTVEELNELDKEVK